MPHDIRGKALIDDLYSILVSTNSPPFIIAGEYAQNAVPLKQTGYAWIFQDPLAGREQANHFWYYVSQGGTAQLLGSIGNYLHETVLTGDLRGRSYQDYALGNEGLVLGAALVSGKIPIGEVGNYIRTNLGPNSSRIDHWVGGTGGGMRIGFYALSVMTYDTLRYLLR